MPAHAAGIFIRGRQNAKRETPARERGDCGALPVVPREQHANGCERAADYRKRNRECDKAVAHSRIFDDVVDEIGHVSSPVSVSKKYI
jgi:hypothetical protein